MDSTMLLQRTLELAHRGAGHVAPNPEVGALIVANGEIVAEGHHHVYGGLHAEADALQRAGDRARGATLFCNLEPCSFHKPGKHQPACTGRIIEAGISRVVIGQLDPNPHVRGSGVERLRAAGIRVDIATDSDPFWRHNRVFNTRMALDRPYVHLKFAASLDGRVATATGESQWITGAAARQDAHRLRARHDAVAVGIGTVLADDPLLTVRCQPLDSPSGDATSPWEPLARQPRAVVFDSRVRLPLKSALVRERAEETIVLAAAEVLSDATVTARKRALEAAGVSVLTVTGATIAPEHALAALSRAGIGSLLVEGGPRLVSGFLRAGLWDGLTAYLAPLIIGRGHDAVHDLGVTALSEARELEAVHWRTVGSDVVLDAMRAGWCTQVMAAVPTMAAHREEEAHVYRAG